MKITMAHGSGGEETDRLVKEVFVPNFENEFLSKLEDAASVRGSARLAVTTDSFVVRPMFFMGGDIGKLSICGTVNDLLMRGAIPKYLTCGFVIEEGTEAEDIKRIAGSMAEAASEAGVSIVAGDTKVVESVHPGGGVVINTAGIGFLREDIDITPDRIREGDLIIVSGNLGDHHAAIMSARMELDNDIISDVSVLTEPIGILLGAGIRVHAMRDITRGGLATILNEFADAAGVSVEIEEKSVPVSPAVRSFCGVMGLNPLNMGNEGKFVAAVDADDAEQALKLVRDTACGRDAAVVGKVIKRGNARVVMNTALGGRRVVPPLAGEGLPRIC